jgi:hypothetical protein
LVGRTSNTVTGVYPNGTYNATIQITGADSNTFTASCSAIVPAPTPTVTNKTCDADWDCASWSACVNGEQTRTCTNSNNCNINKPPVYQACDIINSASAADTMSASPIVQSTPNTAIQSTQQDVNQQLIQLLIQLIKQLQQQVAQMLAQQNK